MTNLAGTPTQTRHEQPIRGQKRGIGQWPCGR